MSKGKQPRTSINVPKLFLSEIKEVIFLIQLGNELGGSYFLKKA